MQANPYNITFGAQPAQNISRLAQANELITDFTAEKSNRQISIITGVRGSGKTVFMTEIASALAERPNWLTVALNPNRDLLTQLAAKLCAIEPVALLFRKAKINLSLFHLGISIDSAPPITDIETALDRMLETLGRHGKRVLVTIDEAANTETMRQFASAYQILLGQHRPIYLLMTGLWENISELQNEKTLTFLYRAPKISLPPLGLHAIAANYQTVLHENAETAERMARMTAGYAFAFQTLGYFTWRHDGDADAALPEYRDYLDEYSYGKIWAESSQNDRLVLHAIAEAPDDKVQSVREALDWSSSRFSPYRQRLKRRGLVDCSEYGHIRFVLPYFREFVLESSEPLL